MDSVTRQILRRTPVRGAAIAVLCAVLGACTSAASSDTFDLTGIASAAGPVKRGKQLLVPEPTALKALDSDSILVRVSGTEIQYLSHAQWSDRLPRMVQSKIVQAFENSGRLSGVGKPGQGLAIDDQLVSDIRAFEITTGSARSAVVEISVKILNDRNGTVKAQKVFRATQPVSGTENRTFVSALDRAFGSVTTQIVDWTLETL